MTIKLPRLPVGWQATPELFERYWDQVLRQTETSINDILTAQAAATAAQAQAQTVTDQTNLANSYVTGLTLTGSDTGTNITLMISNHTRVYGDGTSVSVTGGTVTGLTYGTSYYLYYDQPSRAGGTVAYQSTTTSTVAAQMGSRHVLGLFIAPSSSGATSLFLLEDGVSKILLEGGTDRLGLESTTVTVDPGKPVLPPGAFALPYSYL